MTADRERLDRMDAAETAFAREILIEMIQDRRANHTRAFKKLLPANADQPVDAAFARSTLEMMYRRYARIRCARG